MSESAQARLLLLLIGVFLTKVNRPNKNGCALIATQRLAVATSVEVLSQFSRMDMAPLLAAAVTAGLFLLWSMTYFEAFADAPLLWFLK